MRLVGYFDLQGQILSLLQVPLEMRETSFSMEDRYDSTELKSTLSCAATGMGCNHGFIAITQRAMAIAVKRVLVNLSVLISFPPLLDSCEVYDESSSTSIREGVPLTVLRLP